MSRNDLETMVNHLIVAGAVIVLLVAVPLLLSGALQDPGNGHEHVVQLQDRVTMPAP